jgi:hypothetical protein
MMDAPNDCCPPHCCCCGHYEPCCDCGEIMPSKACIGERCWCGAPAAKKVGEEILFDDPNPDRHNLTRYICAEHYAQLMGPLGAKQVGYTRPLTGGVTEEMVEAGVKMLDAWLNRHIDDAAGADDAVSAIYLAMSNVSRGG